MYEIFLGILLALFIFSLVVLWRNQMVLNTRLWLIDKWERHHVSDPYYSAYESYTYDEMIWNFKCWSRRQFFPELFK